MVSKRNIRGLIEAIKERKDIRDRSIILNLIQYYFGEVTQKDRDEVKNS